MSQAALAPSPWWKRLLAVAALCVAGCGDAAAPADAPAAPASAPAASPAAGRTADAAASVGNGTPPGAADERAWDWPSLACRRGGETWLAAVQWKDGADSIVLRALGQDAASQRVLYRSPTRVLGTALAVDAADALHVVWSEQQGDGWALRTLVVAPPAPHAASAPPAPATPSAKAGGDAGAASGDDAGTPGDVATLLARPGTHLLWPALASDAQHALLLTCIALGGVPENGGSAVLALGLPPGGAWSAPVIVSAEHATPWSASATSTGAGAFAVVWDSARDGDYDIRMATCTLPAQGAPVVHERQRVTDSPRRESHPSAASDGKRLYIAYDVAAERWGREGSVNKLEEALHAGRSLEVVAVQDGDVAPLAVQPLVGMNDVLARNCELPRLALESTGSLVLLFRGLPLPLEYDDPEDPAFAERAAAGGGGAGFHVSIWFTYMTRFDGAAWHLGDKHHLGVPGSEGRADAGAVLARLPGGGHAYAVVGDGRELPQRATPADGLTPEQARAHDAELVAWGRPLQVKPTAVSTGMIRKEPGVAPIALGPARPLPAELSPAMKSATATATQPAPQPGMSAPMPTRTGPDGRTLSLALGDLHRHTDLSRCSSNWDGPFEDALRYAIDVAPLQFLAITDHMEHMVAYDWWRSASWADAYDMPGRFVDLHAYERAEPRSGHRNVIARGVGPPLVGYRNSYDPLRDDARADSGPELWPALDGHDVLTIPHTPAGMFPQSPSCFDWASLDPRFDRLVEIFQSYRGSSEASGAPRAIEGLLPARYVAPNLDLGMHFGLIASSDHQTSDGAFAGAWVASLDRGGVFDALHARLSFASTVRASLWVTWAGVPMGTSGALPGGTAAGGAGSESGAASTAGPAAVAPEFFVQVDGFGRELARLELLSDGGVEQSREVHGTRAEERFMLDVPATGSRSAYVRVTFADGELMWSSPIRLSRDGGQGPDGLSGAQVQAAHGDLWGTHAGGDAHAGGDTHTGGDTRAADDAAPHGAAPAPAGPR